VHSYVSWVFFANVMSMRSGPFLALSCERELAEVLAQGEVAAAFVRLSKSFICPY
jgi:hypothetical protein